MPRLGSLLAVLLLTANAIAQTPSPTTPATTNTKEIDVLASSQWTDSGVDVVPGQSISFTSTGVLQFSDGAAPGPQGASRGWRDLMRSMPVNAAGRGALIGRIGSDDAAQPFLVGAQLSLKVRVPGRLFLGINSTSADSAQGAFHVKFEISDGGSATAEMVTSASASNTPVANSSSAVAESSTSAGDAAVAATLPKNLFTEIPRRITDKDGNVGDMVNFLLIGTEDQLKAAFEAAGWVLVDRDVRDAVLQGLVASLSKQAYVTMPMSQLYLFGRPQDFGFAHAEPIKVVTTRHHLRVWKSTRTVDGQPVWVGAATHDMGLERDQRNGKLTHHIDPNVDDERDFLNRSLIASGYVSKHTRILPSDPIQDAKTATGGGFHSNGEVLVLWLSSN